MNSTTEDYEAACQTIAEMHAAALGYVGGPIEGPLEDIMKLSKLANQLAETVIWMSGAHDFQAGEEAHEGWVRARDGVLSDYLRFKAVPTPDAIMPVPSDWLCGWPDEVDYHPEGLFLGVPI